MPLRVVRWDQRGCGRSSPATAHSVVRYIEDLETIRDAYGVEKWIVGGHSWGASLALQYALAHPERTVALIYISGTGIGHAWNREYHLEADRRRTPAERARLSALTDRTRTPAEESEFRLLSWLPDVASRDRAADLIAQLDEPFALNLDANRQMNAETKTWVEDDLVTRCERATVPTLLVHGARDPRPPWAIDSLAAALPNASVEILPEVGHLPWLENPDRFADLLRSYLAAGHTPAWRNAVERWAKLRDAWLDATASVLAADPRIVGWGLVGSFGRGEADSWSDLDLLVFVRDGDFGAFTSPEGNGYWFTADRFTDARRNAPAGATSVGSLYIRSGLPIGVDWYVYPASMAAWPDDCDIKRGADAAPKVAVPFAEWNGRGPRQPPLDAATSDERQDRLAMVPIAGKYIARRSPRAAPMLAFLGARTTTDEPRDQLEALRELVVELSDESPAWLVATVNEYLALVDSTIL